GTECMLKAALRYRTDAVRDHGLFAVGMVGGQTINFMVEKLGGAEKALLCFFDDPDLARVLIGKRIEFVCS
ncbi:MAG: hypothetical protein WCK00_16115, partial [Deltaproteobacteria bacterium]